MSLGGMTQQRWQRATEWPLAVAALVFLVFYAWEVLADLRPSASRLPDTVMTVVWVAFLLDYVANLVLAERRWHWFWTHLLDLAIVVLPMFRPLRLLRLVRILRVVDRVAGATLQRRLTVYVCSYAVAIVLIAALAELNAEQNAAGSHITTFGAALWWACVTITTVGYGDLVPVTDVGRLVGVGLMVAGIALIGTIAGSLGTWFVSRLTREEEDDQRILRDELRAVTAELRRLREAVEDSVTPAVTPRDGMEAAGKLDG